MERSQSVKILLPGELMGVETDARRCPSGLKAIFPWLKLSSLKTWTRGSGDCNVRTHIIKLNAEVGEL